MGLVVERDIARDDREGEGLAGGADTLDRLDELAHQFRLFGVAEVQIVGGGERLGADGGQVAPAFGDRLHAALQRVGLAIARRHVGGEGQRLGRMAVDAHDAGVAARPLQRIALDQRVVLLEHPAARAQIRRAEQLDERGAVIGGLGDVGGGDRCGRHRLDPWTVVFRRLVAQFLDRQIADLAALPHDAEAQIVGGAADHGEVEAPFDEDRLGLVALVGAQHHEHALLALRQHHLVGAHLRLADRHLVEVQLDAEVALGAHLDG